MKILFSLLICNLIEVFAINPHPSHFKIIPLNFYTPDNRNDKYFKDSNFYGIYHSLKKYSGATKISNAIDLKRFRVG